MKRAVVALSVVIVALAALAAVLGFKSATDAATPQSAASLQNQFVNVVKRVGPAIVQIQTGSGLGSGIIFDSRGDIVTNYHVVGTARDFRVTLANGKIVPGKLVGTFRENDLAVIRIEQKNLRPASFGKSSALEVGDIVLALGNPLGFQSSVTEGIVSALRGPISEGPETGATLTSAIQTSAAINPGNSGGALVNLAGQVVGIPTLAPIDPQLGTPATGIGFAIPSDIAKDLANQIVQHGKVVNSHRAYLGVGLGDAGSGALVGQVESGSPAAKAGIGVGDVLISVAGKRVQSGADVATVLATLKPGQTVKVGVVRSDGSSQTVSVTLGTYPAS